MFNIHDPKTKKMLIMGAVGVAVIIIIIVVVMMSKKTSHSAAVPHAATAVVAVVAPTGFKIRVAVPQTPGINYLGGTTDLILTSKSNALNWQIDATNTPYTTIDNVKYMIALPHWEWNPVLKPYNGTDITRYVLGTFNTSSQDNATIDLDNVNLLKTSSAPNDPVLFYYGKAISTNTQLTGMANVVYKENN